MWSCPLEHRSRPTTKQCLNCGSELRIIAAILERPVIEKILSHLGLDPQPPPKGRAREAGQDFPARVAPVASTSTRAAPPRRGRGGAARHGGQTPQDSGSTLRSMPKPPLVNGQGPAEPGQREGAGTKPWHFMPPQPSPQASPGLCWALLRAVRTPIAPVWVRERGRCIDF